MALGEGWALWLWGSGGPFDFYSEGRVFPPGHKGAGEGTMRLLLTAQTLLFPYGAV